MVPGGDVVPGGDGDVVPGGNVVEAVRGDDVTHIVVVTALPAVSGDGLPATHPHPQRRCVAAPRTAFSRDLVSRHGSPADGGTRGRRWSVPTPPSRVIITRPSPGPSRAEPSGAADADSTLFVLGLSPTRRKKTGDTVDGSIVRQCLTHAVPALPELKCECS